MEKTNDARLIKKNERYSKREREIELRGRGGGKMHGIEHDQNKSRETPQRITQKPTESNTALKRKHLKASKQEPNRQKVERTPNGPTPSLPGSRQALIYIGLPLCRKTSRWAL